MSRPSVVLSVWAGMLGVIALVEWTVFSHGHPDYYLLVAMPAFAIVGTLAFAAAAWLRVRHSDPSRTVAVTELSAPSALTGIAVSAVMIGLHVGLWLVLIGAGLLAAGLGGLIRELRAEPRSRG